MKETEILTIFTICCLEQNEASYLVGVLGAKMTESNMLCFLGGMDGKVINDFLGSDISRALLIPTRISRLLSAW